MSAQGEYKPLCFRRSDKALAKGLAMVNDQDEELKTELLQCASYIHEFFLLLYKIDGFQDYITAYGALEGFVDILFEFKWRDEKTRTVDQASLWTDFR
jgi:hypothetical protein